MGQWDEPDERVKWAIDLFDRQGAEYTTVVGYYTPYVVGMVGGGLPLIFRNTLGRKPFYAGLPFTLAAAAAGMFAGHLFRQYKSRIEREDLAAMKHYIMTHPDRFIEPERKKYGDACVLLPWRCNR